MTFFKTLAIAAVGFAAAIATTPVLAASVSVTCGNNPGRFVTLTTDPGTATCLLASTGNLGGNEGNDVFLGSTTDWILLDKSDSSGNLEEGALTGTPSGLQSGTSGTFSIGTLLGTYSRLAIGFKSGGNQNTLLTAFVFELPAGVTSGNWQFGGTLRNELSHANLYGIERGDGPQPIPLPAAAWLLLSGLGGLGAMGWRKRRALA